MKKAAAFACLLLGCSNGGPSTSSSQGLSTSPDVPGTVFTIIFENENADAILSLPFFSTFAKENGSALQYTSTTHPSLPNYIQLMNGANMGINNDNDPNFNLKVLGNENLPDQLEAGGVPWRAYMESMGTPCKMDSTGLYSAHHNPFLYQASIVDNPARCNEHVVDYDQNFTQDLASNAYRYMWITPNMCNNMHNCPTATGDAWLQNIVATIQASPGYKNGGALFVLFDEGSLRLFGSSATLATVVASPQLVSPGYSTSTAMDHRSYVASIEDIFGLPRLPTTKGVASMDEFFKAKMGN